MADNVEQLSDRLCRSCTGDSEFRLAARHWTGGLRFEMGEAAASLSLSDGVPSAVATLMGAPGVVTLTAAATVWDDLLAAKPPRLGNDIGPLIRSKRMILDADPILFAQYYPAIMRAVELLRAPAPEHKVPARSAPQFDSPVGRYINLPIEGQEYRIYFEEAGSGIPMLLQHTAGGHGAQWRHLFECRELTDRFRLIAYDLPYHGKSLPPVGPKWWTTQYRLKGDFLRAVPLALASALGLERPVFMGCSVGGVMALDLACRHPHAFRAVISLEGALKIEESVAMRNVLWHPQVSDEYKARLMNGLMSPTSPEPFRKETSFIYASGWPPAFLGDLHYYVEDYDLRQHAARIDTSMVGVHILSGEYDPSGTVELGKAAHDAIPGSTWSAMKDVGHFPMSENPQAFLSYLMPVLEQIESMPV